MRLLIVILLVSVVLFSCKDEPGNITPDWKDYTGKVLIGNEGNFGWGEGTLSIYDPRSSSVSGSVFKQVNEETLGNVLHSISRSEDRYFFVINNSQKIVVTDSAFSKLYSIEGFVSPRNMNVVSASKAYVTDLYSDKLYVVDLNSLQIAEQISVAGWIEHSLRIGNTLYLGCMENDKIYLLDLATNQITDSISVNPAVQSMQTDGKYLYALTQGDQTSAAELSVIELSSNLKVDSIEISGQPSHLQFDGESLYYLNEDIYKVTLNTVLQAELFIDLTTEVSYGFALDTTNAEFYVSDVHDFVQSSTVYRYNAKAEEIDRFKCGIISSSFLFD